MKTFKITFKDDVTVEASDEDTALQMALDFMSEFRISECAHIDIDEVG